ncbi:CD1375 family protein [Peribacillus sp. NPDC097206]
MYVALIIAERRTLSQVPVTFRNAVGKDLEALGLDGIGKPILSV